MKWFKSRWLSRLVIPAAICLYAVPAHAQLPREKGEQIVREVFQTRLGGTQYHDFVSFFEYPPESKQLVEFQFTAYTNRDIAQPPGVGIKPEYYHIAVDFNRTNDDTPENRADIKLGLPYFSYINCSGNDSMFVANCVNSLIDGITPVKTKTWGKIKAMYK
ncbi:MAG: hypothetical protein V1802_01515 [Candidatus Aenigmatarchaeota archaeon]